MPEPPGHSRREADLAVGAIGLFAGLDPAQLEGPGSDASRVHLAGGQTLFRQGDPADALFVVLAGRLEVLVEDHAGGVRGVDTLEHGALIGEMALLLGEPRSATVVARRDSELLRIGRTGFERLVASQPRPAFELARVLGARLKRTTRGEATAPRTRTIAIVPVGPAGNMLPGPAVGAFAGRLAAALDAEAGSAALVTPAMAEAEDAGAATADPDSAAGRRLQGWMCGWEDRFRYVLYEADPSRGHWTTRCLRQADVVLLVAPADAPPPDQLPAPAAGYGGARRELVLLRATAEGAPARLWLEASGCARHHHVAADSPGDHRRLARSLAGRAVGLVLSGGGARGFAHIGVLKAMAEQGIPIDAIGGSSMGAIVAALHAAGLDVPALVARMRQAFVSRQARDLTLPVVALTTGSATVAKMQRLFGDVQIEDLRIPYFCMSTNLSRATSVVHDRGPLWLWTRVSCAIPGLAPPVAHGGDLLVDGGLLNNLPADVMRSRCDGAVIGVDVTPGVDLVTSGRWPVHTSGWRHLWDRIRRTGAAGLHPSIVEILSRTALVSSMRDAVRMQAHCDLYIQPDVEHVGMTDFKAIDALVDAGYRAAADCLPRWLDARRALADQRPPLTP
jgi:NTE family protein